VAPLSPRHWWPWPGRAPRAARLRADPPRRRRPLLEVLEDRTAPSAYHVTSLLDTGAGSGLAGDLRYCLTQANANPGPDTIAFDVTGTIALQSALPALSDDVDVQGPGAASLTVSGGGSYRVFAVSAGVTAGLSGLTVADGRVGSGGPSGAGILNQGTLAVSDCALTGNRASRSGGGASGGGVANAGTLTVTRSALTGNSVSADSAFLSTATADGGAIANTGTLTVADSTLSGNSADAYGGRYGAASAHGGAIWSTGTLTVTGCTLTGNSVSAGTGTSTPSASGGGIDSGGTSLTVRNSTVAGNSATGGPSGGGGVSVSGGATLANVTVTNNRASSGGGLSGGAPLLRNALVAGNAGGDVSAAVDPGSDHNLVGDGTGMTGISDGVNGNQVGTASSPLDPRLGPLADNGGPTQTCALLPGSPALDAGNNLYATEFDQRGPGFYRVRNSRIDVGAFEAQVGAIALLYQVTRSTARAV
jgi:hypothetical protein